MNKKAGALNSPEIMSNKGRAISYGSKGNIYTYEAPWLIYGLSWSVRRDKKFRLALGSYQEDSRNRVDIVQFNEETEEFVTNPNLTVDHPYPVTKILFVPDKDSSKPDLMATVGDHLRVWQILDDEIKQKALLKNKETEFCAPIASFDWSEYEPHRLGTAGVDAMCTIWDIEKEVMETQLLAHDKEVFDIAWGSAGVFASVSADGSVRLFDLRDKKHSTIIYESPQPDTPLLRLVWNRQKPHYMATIASDSNKVLVLDIRYTSVPVVELQRHQASVNTIGWAPHSPYLLCSGGDDSEVLMWDVTNMSEPVDGGLDPIMVYGADSGINQLQWSTLQPEWVSIAFSRKLQLLRV